MPEKYSFIVVKYPLKGDRGSRSAGGQGIGQGEGCQAQGCCGDHQDRKGQDQAAPDQGRPASKGFLKGGVIGIIFAVLFGGAAWIAVGALLGTAFAMFDRGIKNKLLKELGEKMTTDESALAVLVEEADWDVVKERMAAHNFQGEVVVSEIVEEHLDKVEELAEDSKTIEVVPEEVELPAE